jgi:hypothetical protein
VGFLPPTVTGVSLPTAGSEVEIIAGSEVEIIAGSEVEIIAGSEVEIIAGSEVEIIGGSEVEIIAGSEVEITGVTGSCVGIPWITPNRRTAKSANVKIFANILDRKMLSHGIQANLTGNIIHTERVVM